MKKTFCACHVVSMLFFVVIRVALTDHVWVTLSISPCI